MIEITCYLKGSKLSKFVSRGHADFDTYGKDIVCSAISSIIIGGLNALKNIEDFQIKIEKGYVECKCLKEIDDYNQIVFDTMITQIKTVHKQFPTNIRIEERNGWKWN